MSKPISDDFSRYIIGIDIGGTKIQIACVKTNGNLLWTKKEIIKKKSRNEFMNQILSLCKKVFKYHDINECMGIGVAIPAVISKDNNLIIHAPNITILNNYKFKETFLNRFIEKYNKSIPVVLGFDGTASVVAEKWIGVGKRYSNIATVIMGTGIGCGIMIDGKILYGANNVIGALGWSRLGISKNVQSFEEICSGPAISCRSKKYFKKLKKNVSILDTKKIFDLAEKDNQYAKNLIKKVITYTGMNLSNLVSMLNPEIIILGGSVGLRLKPYLSTLKETIQNYSQPIAGETVLLKCSELGINEGVLGAAGLILFGVKNLYNIKYSDSELR